jgi:hypothetical protein
MRVIEIGLNGHFGMVFNADEIDDILHTVQDMLPEIANGESITIKIAEMTEKEFENLSEFSGW